MEVSNIVKRVNLFFRSAIKDEVDELMPKLLLTDRQYTIFNMYYIEDLDINFIADKLGVCNVVVSKDLKAIRDKISKVLGYK